MILQGKPGPITGNEDIYVKIYFWSIFFIYQDISTEKNPRCVSGDVIDYA